MLREVAKRDFQCADTLVRRHDRDMPRTVLRYTIKQYLEPRRKAYLAGQIDCQLAAVR
jgi:hypothetical protein